MISDMDRTQHVIDAIDGALADYRVSGDAMRWTSEPPAARPPTSRLRPVPVITPEQAAELFRRTGEAIRPAILAATETARVLGEHMAKVQRALIDAGALPELPPTEDAQARALWLAQHRNTGPNRDATRQKRPLRLH